MHLKQNYVKTGIAIYITLNIVRQSKAQKSFCEKSTADNTSKMLRSLISLLTSSSVLQFKEAEPKKQKCSKQHVTAEKFY